MRYRLFFSFVALFLVQVILGQTNNKDQFVVDSSVIATYGGLENKEWKRFKNFRERLQETEADQNSTSVTLRNFSRDSLRILEIKLMAIRLLDEKQLLDHDIAENPKYYLGLLEECKSSDLSPHTYRFLEQKLAYLTQEKVENKYALSQWVNVILTVVILALLWFVIRQKKVKTVSTTIPLSRREQNIHQLILEGKTNKEIANELFISVSTVKTHITHIYHKLNVTGRHDLMGKINN